MMNRRLLVLLVIAVAAVAEVRAIFPFDVYSCEVDWNWDAYGMNETKFVAECHSDMSTATSSISSVLYKAFIHQQDRFNCPPRCNGAVMLGVDPVINEISECDDTMLVRYRALGMLLIVCNVTESPNTGIPRFWYGECSPHDFYECNGGLQCGQMICGHLATKSENQYMMLDGITGLTALMGSVASLVSPL